MDCPPIPSSAERAKTLAARPAGVNVTCGDLAGRITPVLLHTHASGEVMMVLPSDSPVVDSVMKARQRRAGALVELADHAPVPMRGQVRGLLWITGWLTLLTGESARERAWEVSHELADERLLDVGHTASVVLLEPVSLTLGDGEGTEQIDPADFAAAERDSFWARESHWLQHLQCRHSDVVSMLARHLPGPLLRSGPVMPLGIDRLGIRLRVETSDGDRDVRLGFSRSVTTEEELSAEVRRLAGLGSTLALGESARSSGVD
ncbi:DUF2470 domain-containing protein [Saccharopolyspora tripterygii]